MKSVKLEFNTSIWNYGVLHIKYTQIKKFVLFRLNRKYISNDAFCMMMIHGPEMTEMQALRWRFAYNSSLTDFVFFCLSLPWKYRFSEVIYHRKTSIQLQIIWSKFHIDPSPESLLNGQLKMLGMVQKKLYWDTLNSAQLDVACEMQRLNQMSNLIIRVDSN